MNENKRGPGRPKKIVASAADTLVKEFVADAPGESKEYESQAIVQANPEGSGPQEIKVRVVRRYERAGSSVPVGTVFTAKYTRELRRQIKHRCLEIAE